MQNNPPVVQGIAPLRFIQRLLTELQHRIKYHGVIDAAAYLLRQATYRLPAVRIRIAFRRDLRKTPAIGIPPPHLTWQIIDEPALSLIEASFGPLTKEQFRQKLSQNALGMLASENGIVEHYAWISTHSSLVPPAANQCHLVDFYTSARCNDLASVLALRFKQLTVARQAGAHTAFLAMPLFSAGINRRQLRILEFEPAALIFIFFGGPNRQRHIRVPLSRYRTAAGAPSKNLRAFL
ncbi:MAG: hypothetical protein NC924_09990 [Candidatus Omnitrophica bacterium]|nr:hypothetical protein [Candidatus Omnitrophota bacterium]